MSARPRAIPALRAMGYFLRPGLSFCRLGGRLVFLDRHADRYFGLSDPLERAMADMIGGEPADPERTGALVARGILVEHSGIETLVAPVDRPTAHDSLLSNTSAAAGPTTIVAAAARQIASRWLIRTIGFDRALRRFERLRSAALPATSEDVDHARRIAAYHQTATLLTAAHQRCLPNAHAIGCELARAGLAVSLIFGVKLRPFEAHCWVELGDAVVNDRLDLVRTYTPILVV